MQDFRKLRVWEAAQQLAAEVNQVASQLRDVGGLRAQLRRSSESIASNIAEGARRQSPADFAHFLQTAIASASECESQLDLLRRLRKAQEPTIAKLLEDVVRLRRQIIALRKRVLAPIQTQPRNPEP
ncbi:MAG: four helix bundle protein [Gemmatimonadaceae bacterium]|nr:four helix bundle protein [Gemmatimonadaceae bacterium]